MNRLIATTLVIVAFTELLGSSASAQNRRERREERVAESSKPQNVPGGTTFTNNIPINKAYDTVLNYLKRRGQTIESADRDVGQIITAMTITGGYSQTGSRIQVTLIKESDAQTSIRVAVTKQKRKKLLQAEPWSDPKINADESLGVANEIQSALSQGQEK